MPFRKHEPEEIIGKLREVETSSNKRRMMFISQLFPDRRHIPESLGKHNRH